MQKMKPSLKKSLLLLAVASFDLSAKDYSRAVITKVYFQPQQISQQEVSGRILAWGNPADNNIYLVARNLGPRSKPADPFEMLPVSVGYQVSRYTSVDLGGDAGTPANRAKWQRGYVDDDANGSTAFQLKGTAAGIMINSHTWKPSHTMNDGGPNAQYGLAFNPIRQTFANQADILTVQATVGVPWVNTGGAPKCQGEMTPSGQLGFGFRFKDITTNTFIDFGVNLYESRPVGCVYGGDYIGSDTHLSFVSAPLSVKSKYIDVSPFVEPVCKAQKNVVYGNKCWVRIHIPYEKFALALRDIRNQHGSSLSLNPADYFMTAAWTGMEIANVAGSANNMSMGASIEEFMVFNVHAPN
ncbi:MULTISPECIES: hypothetical protein [unclassified Pseudomonas]|uniref:hypothetical protein n=1 Tax=unclassified Pseudomonas TaxID=196821 RepID=UPI00244B2AAF|nr:MULTISPECIES: hypothetical protein [unclassified Pseudomonas]MDG9928169.1 hypothetical protein [Pseudomonas sp. GD04042]MDH0481267.1 hypothetical protein [Pseudomonas sp. GD04015]MDH0605174.1 hypothetical protein [Pseudomonas sp. GD03869]